MSDNTKLTQEINKLNQLVVERSEIIMSQLGVLSTQLRVFNLETLRDIIEKQSPVRIAVDDYIFDKFDSLMFPANTKEGEWLKENLPFKYISYRNCVIHPEPTLTVLKEMTGLSTIVGIRIDNSIYVEGLIPLS